MPSGATDEATAADGAVVVGLVLVIRARKPSRDLDALPDAAAVGVAALVMAWDLLIQPAIDPTASTGATVLFALYPVFDVVLLALLVRLLLDTQQPVHPRPACGLTGC